MRAQVCDELNRVIEAALEDEEADAPALADFLTVGQVERETDTERNRDTDTGLTKGGGYAGSVDVG